MLNYIEPEKFSSLDEFQREYGQLQDSEQVLKLQEQLKPHFLRRMKDDVEKSIPPKEETIIEVELTSLQKQYYRAVLERNRAFLQRGVKPNNAPNLLNVVMVFSICMRCFCTDVSSGIAQGVQPPVPDSRC